MRFESTPFCNLFQWVAYQMPIFFPIYVWVNYSSSSITLYLDALFVCSYLFKISQTFLCIFLTLQLQVFTEIKSLQRSSLYHTFNLPAMYLAKKHWTVNESVNWKSAFCGAKITPNSFTQLGGPGTSFQCWRSLNSYSASSYSNLFFSFLNPNLVIIATRH